MSGAGNDFVVIDNRDRKIKSGAKVARALCDRRQGIGADGLLLLEKSRRAGYKMMYFNADGSYGGMCGNGGRCIAAYAILHRVAPEKHVFEALDYLYNAEVADEEVELEMKDPKDLKLDLRITAKGRNLGVNYVNTGSPHVVVPVKNLPGSRNRLDSIDVVGLGKEIRLHKAFAPEGTNVNFVERMRSNIVRIRTYERGVEDETLACGTGSIASAIVASRIWDLRSPVTILPRSGMRLRVFFARTGDIFTNVRLKGPAQVVFEGTVEL